MSALRGGGRAELAERWGCCALNHLADRAGCYRRLAIGLAAMPVPLVIMAAGGMLSDGWPLTGSALTPLVTAVGCGWLAVDLVRTGSALRLNGRPHTGSVVLLGGIGLLVILTGAEPVVGFGLPMLRATGLAALVGGFIVLMAAERQRDRSLAVIGRWAVVTGSVSVGAIQLGGSVPLYPVAPVEAVGVGVLAVMLLAMGGCEARVLRRGAALSRALAQR